MVSIVDVVAAWPTALLSASEQAFLLWLRQETPRAQSMESPSRPPTGGLDSRRATNPKVRYNVD
jgi:hypothetical protein